MSGRRAAGTTLGPVDRRLERLPRRQRHADGRAGRRRRRRRRRSSSSTAPARSTAGASPSRGSSQFRVLIPFHPGFGESGDLEGLREVHDLVLHYVELFDQLGLTRDVNLVGFSLGGLIAARFAIEQKHRLRRLVLVAPAGLRVPGVDVDDLFRIPPEELPGRLVHRMETLAAAPAHRPPRRRLHRRPLPGDPHHGHHAVGAPLRPGAAALARPGRHPDARGVGRGRPARCPPALAPAWAALLPDATVATFPEAGHLVLDESADASAAVARFCAAPTDSVPAAHINVLPGPPPPSAAAGDRRRVRRHGRHARRAEGAARGVGHRDRPRAVGVAASRPARCSSATPRDRWRCPFVQMTLLAGRPGRAAPRPHRGDHRRDRAGAGHGARSDPRSSIADVAPDSWGIGGRPAAVVRAGEIAARAAASRSRLTRVRSGACTTACCSTSGT